jgi:hydrogenase-4 component F
MLLALIAAPLVLGLLALAFRDNDRRPAVLLAGAVVHALGMALVWARPVAAAGRYLAVDAVGKLALTTTTLLFLACAVYAQGYLKARRELDNRIFVGGLLLLLAAMTAIGLAQHLGVMWVAIELTTLSTAPLIYFNHNARALEAAWKYLLVCSLGIALALLGTFFLALSGAAPDGPRSLFLQDLVAAGPALSKPWVRAGFVFLLVGYGTKMGLAPLHSWKPDAYGEAPGILGALLSGGVTTFAFVALGRVLQVCRAAGEDAFSRDALVAMGLLSMAVAAVFMLGQRDFKRMLAWSSVEHMGILALGLGVGGVAASGAFFHSIGNGLTKGVLFLSAANIHRAFGSKLVKDVRGAARRLPLSGPLFFAGFLAVTGTPPFSPFFSEFSILHGALGAGRFVVGALYLAFLGVIFVGMGATVLKVVQGAPPAAPPPPGAEDGWLSAGPPLVLLGLVLLMGLVLPPELRELFDAAAALVVGAGS